MSFVAGLAYSQRFLDSLPILLPRPAPHAPIRAITAHHFAKIRHKHITSDVPDNVLFPFLHGLEGDNHAQNHFFSKNGLPVPVPAYRGLIWVLCDDDDDLLPLNNEEDEDEDIDIDDDLLFLENANPSIPTVSNAAPTHNNVNSSRPMSIHSGHSGVDSMLSSSPDSLFSQSVVSLETAATSIHSSPSCSSLPTASSSKPPLTSHLLTSTFHPSELIIDTQDGPQFIPPIVPKGISLRNFGIQVPIYATLSDIVIYSPKGLTRPAFALAQRFKLAIESKREQRLKSCPSHLDTSNLLTYNVFVVSDPFSTFETHYPDLISIASNGTLLNHISFPVREMTEMRELTHASEIHPGVLVGNSGDVPMWQKGDSDSPFDWNVNNPDGYDICVECYDQAPYPHAQLLKQAEEHLAALDALWATGYSSLSSPFFSPSAAPPRPPPNANTIIHFSFPSAPPSRAETIPQLTPFISFLQSVLHRPRRCKVLIYSHDGYTESSILALTLLMAEKRCSLPEAYLELQVVRGRSFFVHQWDLGILRRIEAKYARSGGEGREKEKAGREKGSNGPDKWGSWAGAFMGRNHHTTHAGGHGLSSSIPTTPSSEFGQPHQAQTQTTTQNTSQRRARAQTSPLLPALIDHTSWFNDDRFDGSFPSRVLPFLYLGNLNHASNAYMLHALGITHVVSVGECALVPPVGENVPVSGSGSTATNSAQTFDSKENGTSGDEYQYVLPTTSSGKNKQVGSLWREEKEGRIKVLDIKGVCDDGIDSLRPAFASICAWIDKARMEGGKVLVHCRVGVSRSATVTIAYVMKHLGISLVDAYLIVRSRRLSVLIQPNMRLLYNLCGWEVELARSRVYGHHHNVDDDDEEPWLKVLDESERAVQKNLNKSLNWPFLAREVHLLNEKYLH
ncbi:hypothetical protein Clacol_002544 [Clathrus columnatus]|uniref:Protein-tyrosine-phosphatase n=1 Tax=Clathrus columnatus TaxID=1419009 RepID=A0AAV5A560_9AGAM|nr:hypothetical protein Clacol_002544 [Clathrus columnatus]